MKYNIVDSVDLVKQKSEGFKESMNKINAEFNNNGVKEHLEKLLLLEEYIKYTKKTVNLNSLIKRLYVEQQEINSILYQENKFDMFERLSVIVEERMIEALEKQFYNYSYN